MRTPLEQFVAQGNKRDCGGNGSENGGVDVSQKTSDDIIFHSVLPWIRFTSFSNALPGKGDSIPRVVFGQCVREHRPA